MISAISLRASFPSRNTLLNTFFISANRYCNGSTLRRKDTKKLPYHHDTENSFVIILELLCYLNLNPFGAEDATFIIAVAWLITKIYSSTSQCKNPISLAFS